MLIHSAVAGTVGATETARAATTPEMFNASVLRFINQRRGA
jgi:hypothetical protein